MRDDYEEKEPEVLYDEFSKPDVLETEVLESNSVRENLSPIEMRNEIESQLLELNKLGKISFDTIFNWLELDGTLSDFNKGKYTNHNEFTDKLSENLRDIFSSILEYDIPIKAVPSIITYSDADSEEDIKTCLINVISLYTKERVGDVVLEFYTKNPANKWIF